MADGYPLPSRLGGLGERHKLPSGVRAENECWCIRSLQVQIW